MNDKHELKRERRRGVSRSFLRGLLTGLLLSVFFWRACAWVDHTIAGALHEAHGGEPHTWRDADQ
jgi:hypothetical protein